MPILIRTATYSTEFKHVHFIFVSLYRQASGRVVSTHWHLSTSKLNALNNLCLQVHVVMANVLINDSKVEQFVNGANWKIINSLLSNHSD